MPTFVSVTAGRQQCAGGLMLPRHRHRTGYMCLVLAGGYEEAGDHGRFRVTVGDVILHRPFEAHLDRFSMAGADTLNLGMEGWSEHPFALARVADPDQIARIAEQDPTEARDTLIATVAPAGSGVTDWPDELACSIRNDPNLNLGEWARTRDLAPATLSRGFRRVYEVTPTTFRAQTRARHAWRSIMRKHDPLSAIALESGFADQAHMTRAVHSLTGRTPAQWRGAKSNRFKT